MGKAPSWEAAYCEFFQARQRSYTRTAFAMLGSWTDAEDATQQTFTALYVTWPRIPPGKIEAYGRRVLVNTCIGVYRKRGRESPRESPPDHGVWEDPDKRLHLLAALGQLNARDRAVLALRFLEDLSIHEVAQVLELPEGTVKSQTRRALSRLQDVLNTTRKEPSR